MNESKTANPFNHSEHLHNFACWTTARAAQRRFPGAKTPVIKRVLEDSGFPQTLKRLYESEPTEKQYDEWHADTVNRLCEGFRQQIVEASYGQIAKVIAIYLKTIYVTRHPTSALAHVAHPPIDRILLQNVKRCRQTATFTGSVSWTQFDLSAYQAAVAYLRNECNGQPFWTIERYWTI